MTAPTMVHNSATNVERIRLPVCHNLLTCPKNQCNLQLYSNQVDSLENNSPIKKDLQQAKKLSTKELHSFHRRQFEDYATLVNESSSLTSLQVVLQFLLHLKQMELSFGYLNMYVDAIVAHQPKSDISSHSTF